ncbi:type II toxin-antitoxin system MqsA family antitoxin [Duganella sp.]|uniref:type II toxin-antitoxin system MqsA family antitoxin n=1 Tax=Duganella sp. TaxID=1904440 RepID=UPI0031D89780
MKCPTCGNAELVHDTRDVPFSRNGATSTIEAVTGDFCPACVGMVLDTEQGARYAKLVKHRQAVSLIAGLWKDRDGGSIDGVEYQKKVRSEW